jgi:hypothetical protein
MIDKEKELRGGAGGAKPAGGAGAAQAAPEVQCGSHLKKPEELTGFPKFPAGTKSLLFKNLTPEMWAKYHDKKDKHGFSFKAVIFSGCQNTDSGVGVYAGSHDSYHAF